MCRLFSRMTICHASLGQSTEKTTSEAAGLKKGIGDPNCISDFTPVTETIYTICVKGALPPQVMYFNIDPVFKSILYFWLVTQRIGIQSTSGLGNSYPLNYLHHLGITPKQRSFIPQKRLLFQFQMQFFFFLFVTLERSYCYESDCFTPAVKCHSVVLYVYDMEAEGLCWCQWLSSSIPWAV